MWQKFTSFCQVLKRGTKRKLVPFFCLRVHILLLHSIAAVELHRVRIYILITSILFIITSPSSRICNRRYLFVCLFVYLLATLRKNFRTDLHDIFRESLQWANEQVVKFRCRSGSRNRMATLVRRALTEVCTVPVLLVIIRSHQVLRRCGLLLQTE